MILAYLPRKHTIDPYSAPLYNIPVSRAKIVANRACRDYVLVKKGERDQRSISELWTEARALPGNSAADTSPGETYDNPPIALEKTVA